MFGMGKKNKEVDVRLTQKELDKITSGMSRKERKEFMKRQNAAEVDRFTDAMIWGSIFMDDDDD